MSIRTAPRDAGAAEPIYSDPVPGGSSQSNYIQYRSSLRRRLHADAVLEDSSQRCWSPPLQITTPVITWAPRRHTTNRTERDAVHATTTPSVAGTFAYTGRRHGARRRGGHTLSVTLRDRTVHNLGDQAVQIRHESNTGVPCFPAELNLLTALGRRVELHASVRARCVYTGAGVVPTRHADASLALHRPHRN